MQTKKLIVGITGASGAILGVRLLQQLKGLAVETYLVLSPWGAQTLALESGMEPKEIAPLASRVYSAKDMSAEISSGSFRTDGMVIVPCSMATLGAIATGTGSHLVHRAADVTLKERRKLVLVTREAPLSVIHLENMLKLAKMGVTIFPPVPAFYNLPKTIEDVVDYTVCRILDQFGIAVDHSKRWNGKMNSDAKNSGFEASM